jgi:hypothetical protein
VECVLVQWLKKIRSPEGSLESATGLDMYTWETEQRAGLTVQKVDVQEVSTILGIACMQAHPTKENNIFFHNRFVA